MVKQILIDTHGIGHAVAIKENGILQNLFIDPLATSAFFPPSAILIAKISRQIKERGGYFIKLQHDKEGFLLSKKNYLEGDELIVIAKIFNERDKLQRFSDVIKLETKYFVIKDGDGKIFFSKKFSHPFLRDTLIEIIKQKTYDLSSPPTVIVRSSVCKNENLEWKNIFNDALNDYLKRKIMPNKSKKLFFGALAKEKALRIYGTDGQYNVIERPGIFELSGLWDEIDNLLLKKVYFGKKSYLMFEQTAAFCSIDVNTGSNLQISPEKVNLDACKTIVDNIRLRAVGGKVIIDFLPCSNGCRKKILKKMEDICSMEANKFSIFGWTKGNNFEIELERDKIPLNLILGN